MDQMVEMIKGTLEKYSFEQALSITTLSEKCSMGVIPIIYKRPDENQRAHQCFDELWQRGVEIGCHPYRINIAAMRKLTKGQDSTFWHTVEEIKSALDPAGILSPGRYARHERRECGSCVVWVSRAKCKKKWVAPRPPISVCARPWVRRLLPSEELLTAKRANAYE